MDALDGKCLVAISLNRMAKAAIALHCKLNGKLIAALKIGQQYGIKNKAAIALQCKLNGKLIAALKIE